MLAIVARGEYSHFFLPIVCDDHHGKAIAGNALLDTWKIGLLSSIYELPHPLNDEAPLKPRGFRVFMASKDIPPIVRYRAYFPDLKV